MISIWNIECSNWFDYLYWVCFVIMDRSTGKCVDARRVGNWQKE